MNNWRKGKSEESENSRWLAIITGNLARTRTAVERSSPKAKSIALEIEPLLAQAAELLSKRIDEKFLELLAESIWPNVQKGSPDECWPWKGPVNEWGYGRAPAVIGKRLLAHVAVFLIVHGPIPEGHIVRHRCDNPPCCNPGHLLSGTQKQNIADAVSRGRMASGPRHGSKTKPDRFVGRYSERNRKSKGIQP